MANISGQIAQNLNSKLKIHFELQNQILRKPELKSFIRKISKTKDFKQNFIHKPKFSQILFFNKVERKKILEKFNLSSNTQIQFGFKATINNTSINNIY